jgi:hypothetical protein
MPALTLTLCQHRGPARRRRRWRALAAAWAGMAAAMLAGIAAS